MPVAGVCATTTFAATYPGAERRERVVCRVTLPPKLACLEVDSRYRNRCVWSRLRRRSDARATRDPPRRFMRFWVFTFYDVYEVAQPNAHDLPCDLAWLEVRDNLPVVHSRAGIERGIRRYV
jgi:hypothetical protein